jgi:hypothetical protein
MISDTSSKFATNPDEILQSMLTKTSIQPGAPITWNDMCAAVMQEQDAVLANTKVFMKVSFTRGRCTFKIYQHSVIAEPMDDKCGSGCIPHISLYLLRSLVWCQSLQAICPRDNSKFTGGQNRQETSSSLPETAHGSQKGH